MVDQDAPESDIDEYIASEGVSLDDVHNYKGEDSFYQRNIPNPIKNAVGGIESVGRMLWNVPAGTIAKGAGALTGLAMGEDLPMALQRGEEASSRVSIDPFTKQGEQVDEALGQAYEKLYREPAGGIVAEDLRYDPNAPAGSVRADPRQEAKARTMGEFGADVLAFAGLPKGIRDMAARSRALREQALKETELQKIEEQRARGADRLYSDNIFERRAQPKEGMEQAIPFDDGRGFDPFARGERRKLNPLPYEQIPIEAPPFQMARGSERTSGPQENLFNNDPTIMATEIQKSRREAAQGEIETLAEQQAFLNRELGGRQPDMFTPDRIESRYITGALEYPGERSGVREPIPFETGQRPGLEGSELPTRSKAIPFERTPVERPLTRDDALPYTMEPILPEVSPSGFERLGQELKVESVPFERPFYPNDPILKGMEANLERKTAELDRLRNDHARIINEYQGRVMTEPKARSEIAGLSRSIDKMEKAVSNLTKDIERKKSTNLKLEERGKSREFPKGPGRRQGGAINPEVFIEGFQKVKDLGERGLKLIAKFRKDSENPYPGVLEVTARNQKGDSVGLSLFTPTREGLKELKDKDLYSVGTDVEPSVQRQGIATEMYKFVQELGNDVVPSKFQSDSGKAMWEGFKAKGVPLRQRGGATPDFLTGGLTKLIDRALRKKEPGPPVKLNPKDRVAALEAASGETRSFKDFWEKEGPDLKDLPDSWYEKGLEYGSNAQQVYNNSHNPMVKYVADRVAQEKTQASLKHELATEGVNLGGKGLILPKKVVDPNSPKARWDGLNKKERDLATSIINDYSGKSEPSVDMMRAKGASQKVIDAVKTLQEPLKDFIHELNQHLIAIGKNPIKELPFYFMRAVGDGNFLIRARKITGLSENGKPIYETVAFSRARTSVGADMIVKEWKSKYEARDLEIGYELAKQDTKGNKFNIDTTLLEDIYTALESADPRREALMSAAAEIRSKAGPMGSHRVFRKGREGMDLTHDNFWDTYSNYLDSGYNYLSNLKLSELMKDIQLRTDIPPQVKQWSLDYLNRQRAGEGSVHGLVKDLEKGLDNTLYYLSGKRVAPGQATNFVRFSNKLFTSQALFFGNVPFLVGQMFQSTAFAPAILAEAKYTQGMSKGSVTKSMVTGPMNMFTKNPEFQGIVDFLTKRGKIDPTMVREFEMFGNVGHGAVGWTYKLIEMGYIPRKLEALNRVHAASIAYDFLKDNGLKGKDLKMEVERMVDNIMGNYSSFDRPGIVSRNGILGEGIAPLLTFKNWFTATTLTMMKEAIRGAATGNFTKAIPMVNLFAGFLTFGGVVGMVGFKEMDALWELLKSIPEFQKAWKATTGKVVNEKSPSLSEEVLTSEWLPNAGKFGILTGATQMVDPRGMHISGSMAAGEFMPSAIDGGISQLAPGAAKIGNLGLTMVELIRATLGTKELTEQDKRRLAKGVLPTSWGKVLDNLDEDLNWRTGVVPGGKRGFGTVERRDAWDIGASIAGAGTIPEYSKKMATRDIKEQAPDLAAAKSHLIDLTLEAVMNGQDASPYIERAMQLGITDFQQALVNAYKNKEMPEAERMLGRGTNPNQFERWNYINRAGQEGQYRRRSTPESE